MFSTPEEVPKAVMIPDFYSCFDFTNAFNPIFSNISPNSKAT